MRSQITKKVAIFLFIIAAFLLSLFLAFNRRASGSSDAQKRQDRNLLVADLKWKVGELVDKYDKHVRLPFMKIETPTPDRFSKVVIEEDVAIPMRDGTLLYADIYKPKDAARLQVILIRLPYGKDEYYCWMPAVGKFWARKGYICVVQDVRGRFSSEGTFWPFVKEAQDGYDTIDWIAKQPWCDGNIGMMGESYYGYTTWAAATTNHPNLKCIAPSNIAIDPYSAVFQNGAFCLQTLGIYPILMNSRTYQNVLKLDHWHLPLVSMADEAGIRARSYKELIQNPLRNDGWERINLKHHYDRVKIPVLSLAGWYDVFLRASIEDWAELRDSRANTELAGKEWLVIGPGDHESTTERTNRVGRLDIGDKSATTRWEVMQAFFDYYLKGVNNDFEKTPKVRIFVIGDNDWRYESEWPLARTEFTNYYFRSQGEANTLDGDGKLSTERPRVEPHDTYVYDPLDPVTASYEIDLWSLAEQLKDRLPVEERDDVLVYTTPELEKDLEITGPISVSLYAASSAVDTDFTAALVDVFPDGYIHLIQEGIIRASYRNSDSKLAPIEPEKVYEYKLDLWATSYVIKKGHKLGVEISSSNFDRFDRNPNTGKPFGTSPETIKATQKIYHSARYPSRITLPIIPR